MTRRFTRILAALALLVFMTPSLVALGQTQETVYTFTTKAWDDATHSWQSDKDGTQTGDARGIAVQKSESGAGATTKNPISNITSIVLNAARSSKGVGSIDVKVGNNTVLTQSTFNTTSTDYTVNFDEAVSGNVSFVVTCTTSTIYVKSITITTSNGGSGSDTYSVTIADGITGGTVSATPTSQVAGGLVTITATPNDGYTFNNIADNWSVTDGDDQTIQVTPGSNNNATFEMPESDVTVSATFTAKPTHSITIASDIENGSVTASLESAYEGQTVTLTVNPSQGYELTNITVEDQSGNNVELNGYTFVMPNSNVFVSATFALIPTTVSDELNRVFTGVASGAGYSSWSNKTGASGAVYAGRSAGGNNSIQLRDSDNSGIISTTSGGKLRAVIVDWNTNTTNGRTLDIYGSNTAYNATSDLYNSNTQGTKLGSIVKGTSTLSITGNYKYIGIRSNNGAMYLDEIKIQWVQTNDPSILAENVGIEYNATSGAIEYVINNPATDGTVTAAVTNGNWLTLGEVTDGAVAFTCSSNGSYASRPATVVLTYTYGDNQTTTATVTVTQAGAPYPTTTYTLATSIESGKHYIISDGSTCAMGMQNDNNRAAVEITIDGATATVGTYDVYEFVINGPDKDGFYTIYDVREPGYLYAVGGTSNNHLKTETFCQDHGRWTISFNAETHAASVVANISGRNTMRYNSSGSVFSCYASGQSDIYLYVKNETTPQYDFYKDIAGHTTTSGWNFIASPTGTAPTNMNALSDLYFYDEDDSYWRNKKVAANGEGFRFSVGTGYLAASENNITLSFSGTSIITDETSIPLVYTENAKLAGWNLVGNPYPHRAYADKSYYVIDGLQLNTTAQTKDVPVDFCAGIMVKATGNGQSVTFSKTPANSNSNQLEMTVAQQVMSRGTATSMVHDNAIVNFNAGSQLEKFPFNADAAELYIPQDGKDYAIVSSETQGEMPVNFKAKENGTYTLSINVEGMEMNYLHLIDNKTGNDVDLLQTPSYSFEAKTTDYESRFKLVFVANNEESVSAGSETFAFFSNGSFVINNEGNAELQVIDITGRIVKSESINGCANVNVNATPGVYMLRLVNGDNVKTQKVVVK